MRKGLARRRLAGIGATLALGVAPVIAVQAPALASTNFHVCESSGSYCIGSDNLNEYTAVVEKAESTGGGRNITYADLGTQYCIPNQPLDACYEEYEIQLTNTSNPVMCVASANNGDDAEIKVCNGGTGVVWALLVFGSNNPQPIWCSPYATSVHTDGLRCLMGHDNGSPYVLRPYPTANGYFRFSQVPA